MEDNKIKITKKVADFIKSKRLAMGMTQTEFAELIFQDGSRKPWISNIERGRPITLLTLEKIFEAINADIKIIEY